GVGINCRGLGWLHQARTLLISQRLGANYKGRIQYNSTTNALSVITKSSATASLVLTDSTTANIIFCNSFEPTTVNTDMIIKANTVLFGDTLTHKSLSGSSSNFYSEAFCLSIFAG
ncbi:MAG: hypothetical protein ACKPKO_43060, partial [Candidatus Fonsibacter sp.]